MTERTFEVDDLEVKVDWKQSKLEVLEPALDVKFDRLWIGVPLVVEHSPLGRDNEFEEKEVICLISSSGEFVPCLPDVLSKNDLRTASVGWLPQRFSVEGVRKYINGDIRILDSIKLFEEIRDSSCTYLDFGDSRINSLLAVWNLGTYVFPLFQYFPYLSVEGEKATGKSKTLRFIAQLAFNAEVELNPTEAGIFRTPGETRGTALFDEFEHLGEQAKDAILQVLRAGFQRGAIVKRLRKARKKGGEMQELERLSVYSPKMFASVWERDEFQERCITIVMARTTNRNISGRHVEESDAVWQDLRDRCYYFALKNWKEISALYETIEVPELEGRPLDIWKPLLSIGKFLGEKIYSELLTLATDMESERKEDDKGKPVYELIRGLGYVVSGLQQQDSYTIADLWPVLSEKCPDMFDWNEARWKRSIERKLGRLLAHLKIKRKRWGTGMHYFITPEVVSDLRNRYGVVSE
jgi:hypothetical protein